MSGKLHTPSVPTSARDLILRAGAIVALLITVVLVLYFEGGLIDHQTGEAPGFLDCIYFTMVTVTTVGYGDIVPESTTARLVDAFFLTPIRFIVFFIFIGIAYQLALKRFQEDFRMNRAVRNLDKHIVVCGYGETGHAAIDEMLLQGRPPDQIVVIETSEAALDEAASKGLVAVMGDAAKESVLKSVAIERAAHILVCPGRDDTAVLIALTAHDLNPSAQIVAMCHENENVRLMQRTGAETIISPSSAGGGLMAAATRQRHLVDTIKDILTVGGALRIEEREVQQSEVGMHPRDMPDIAAIRVYRGERHFEVSELPSLEEGDIIVFVEKASNHQKP